MEVTQEEISEAVGKSRPHITNTLRLLNLPQKIMDMIDQGKITAGHGKAFYPYHQVLALLVVILRNSLSIHLISLFFLHQILF